MQQLDPSPKPSGAAPFSALPPSLRARSPAAWLKRLGAAGFAFFLLKGLLWLALALLAYLARR
jgi:hypothetical protein